MLEIKRQLRQKGGSPLCPAQVSGALQAITEPGLEPEQYPDEDLGESLPYPLGFRHRSVDEQMVVWRELCLNRDASYVPNLVGKYVPRGPEFWFICPKPMKVTRGYVYGASLDWALANIAKQRTLKNWREGRLTPEHLLLVEKTKEAHVLLNQQHGDYWVFPAQLGLQHGGRSMRKARLCLREPEFGLGPYEGACAMLTHPNRISGSGQLWLDCAGCEYSSDADGRFGGCLGFGWSGGGLCLLFVFRAGLASR